MRIRRNSRIWCTLFGVFVGVAIFSFFVHSEATKEAEAASLAGFDPGYIISDWQMGNYNSMNEGEIQTFLTSKNSCSNRDYGYYVALSGNPNYRWHFENGHFICLSEERFGNNDNEIGFQYGETAAHIIWQAAQDYHINPQVLLVLLQKETGLITDPIPNNGDYRKATGFGCPDTAACSSKYYGFKNQIRNAAALFRSVLNGGWTNYPLGNNYIQYNPNAACGGSVVNVRSLATSALYRYTPYQPNAGALAAGYGTASCGAYGNRNFYLYFEDWFGGITNGDAVKAAFDEKYLEWRGRLGVQTKARKCNIGVEGACIQVHENGMIVYTLEYGAQEIYGEIYKRYKEMDMYDGILGFPITGINCDNKLNCYQIYEGSTLLGDSNYKTWFSDASIAKKYITFADTLGAPVANAKCFISNGKNACKQEFDRGTIIYSAGNGAQEIYGEIYKRYKEMDMYDGILGFPITGINCDNKLNCYQIYEGSTLLGDSNYKTWFSDASIAKKYITFADTLGAPVANAKCGSSSCTQDLANGTLSR